MFRIPLGAEKTLRKMWLTIFTIASLVIILILIAQVVYPPLMILVFFGVLGLIVVVSTIVCLGLVDSARVSLEATEQERNNSRN